MPFRRWTYPSNRGVGRGAARGGGGRSPPYAGGRGGRGSFGYGACGGDRTTVGLLRRDGRRPDESGHRHRLGRRHLDSSHGLLRQIEPLPQEQTSFFVADSLQALVFSEPDSLVHDVMVEPVASVGPNVDQEECARLMERYDLAELPVVDDAGRLLGVISFQQVFDIAKEEATEDMHRLVGLGVGESVASSVSRSVLRRLP